MGLYRASPDHLALLAAPRVIRIPASPITREYLATHRRWMKHSSYNSVFLLRVAAPL
jgi:hypothetical protein